MKFRKDHAEGPGLAEFIRRSPVGGSFLQESTPTKVSSGVTGPGQAPLVNRYENPYPTFPESVDPWVPTESASTLVEPSKRQKLLYLETYGCQMNVNDMEIVLSILGRAGYSKETTKDPDRADVILINTCAIRDKAEQRVWQRLGYFKHLKGKRLQAHRAGKLLPGGDPFVPGSPKVAVLGCMAERLKSRLLEADKMVDVVCGPDAYRDLPLLLEQVSSSPFQSAVNVQLSLEETYADVAPVRLSPSSPSAYVSIMRGCDNMCAFCVVPFTRGRERSRPAHSILKEVGQLVHGQGVKEVVLLGQNVNSYRDREPGSLEKLLAEAVEVAARGEGDDATGSSAVDPLSSPFRPSSSSSPSATTSFSHSSAVLHTSTSSVSTATPTPTSTSTSSMLSSSPYPPPLPLPSIKTSLAPGFTSIYKPKTGGIPFSGLLSVLSSAFPNTRFRFTSPHPKDFPTELLELMASRPNICKALHLPAQSGSTTVLGRMRRGYSRETYLALVEQVRRVMPQAALSSDFISGFCGESEEDHQATLSLISQVRYDSAFMFAYSEREKTHAHRRYADDIPPDVKLRRLQEVIAVFRVGAANQLSQQVGQLQLVLVDGQSKRGAPGAEMAGRNDAGHRVIFPNLPVIDFDPSLPSEEFRAFLEMLSVGAEAGGGRAEEKRLRDKSRVNEDLKNAAAGVVEFATGSAGGHHGGCTSVQSGDFVVVRVTESNAASLRAVPIAKSNIQQFQDWMMGPKPKYLGNNHPVA